MAKTGIFEIMHGPLAKSHRDYWKSRLEKRCYTHKGRLIAVNEWSIRIQHLGKRKSFALGTNNFNTAAIKARDIYLQVVSRGWKATEKQFSPGLVARKDDPVLAAFLHQVESESGLTPKSFRHYARYLWRLVADAFGIKKDKALDLLKRADPADVVHAIQEIKHGGASTSGSIGRQAVPSFRADTRNIPKVDKLSQREEQILQQLSKGSSTKEIAAHFFVGVNTVRTHLQHIYGKLHVRSRTEAVVKYLH